MFKTLVISFVSLALAAGVTVAAEADSGAQTHRVAAGESLASIATAAHISLDQLARFNDIEGAAVLLPAGTLLALTARLSQAQPRDSETASEMPTPDADLRMWSGGGRAAPLFSAQSGDKLDTIHRFAHGIISRTSSIAISLTRNAMRYIGTPYVFGGTSPAGFDCSGYVQHVFAMLGIALPRTADAQYYAGRSTHGHMVAGDLVFFQTYLPGPSHVGIYLGTGRFIHSSSHGVMISRIRDSYWASRYLGSKRVTTRVASL